MFTWDRDCWCWTWKCPLCNKRELSKSKTRLELIKEQHKCKMCALCFTSVPHLFSALCEVCCEKGLNGVICWDCRQNIRDINYQDEIHTFCLEHALGKKISIDQLKRYKTMEFLKEDKEKPNVNVRQ